MNSRSEESQEEVSEESTCP